MGKTIIELLEESVSKYGDKPFLHEARYGEDYTSITYLDVQREAIRFEAGLIALGVEVGIRFALIFEGKNTWLLGELGLFHEVVVFVQLSVRFEPEQIILFRINNLIQLWCLLLISRSQNC